MVDVCGALHVGANSGEERQSAGIAGSTGRDAAIGGSIGRRPDAVLVVVVGEIVCSLQANNESARQTVSASGLITGTSTFR